jgi:glutamate synthase domain-containing protein 3
MTAGTVVVLGRVGRNLGAGMTGGEVYVFDPEGCLPVRLNDELVEVERLVPSNADSLRALVERHARFTGSTRAVALLERWDAALESFWFVQPRPEVGHLSRVAEGTAAEGGS